MTVSRLLHDASALQRQAADPTASVWVAASAGTGKTKVLTDRVLALLLQGTPPHRLLCLTFTKAAAAEMANRIALKLADWATDDDATLADKLFDLLGREADAATLTRARRLFAQVLDAPGGMRIETIHAFCQSLLRRFPLEAGLAPHFQVMDERDAAELLQDAQGEVLATTESDLAARVHESSFAALIGELARERGRLARLLARHGGIDGTVTAMRASLGLVPGDSAASLLAAGCADAAFNAAGCRAAMLALEGGGKTDQKNAAAMDAWLADPAGRVATFAAWSLVFLTKDGTIRAKLLTNGVRDDCPGVEDVMRTEAARLLELSERLKAAAVAEATASLLILGAALLAAYQRRKEMRALLDYDDLILGARELLGRPGVAPWVLYKLDGGIDHVLIDEAQDTNPDQWAVVAALTEEFFAGRGISETIRTVFAVGDVKQSIYSFQRADPRAFEEMRHRFAEHVVAAHQHWREVPLNLSFRSTQAVLQAVDRVFADGQPGRDGVAPAGTDISHLARREGQAGLVEVWPPIEPRPLDELTPWKPPVERIRGDSPSGRLAKLIAQRIKAMIGAETLPSKARAVRPGDILVLVRRRGGFVEELVRELKRQEVTVAGADRMVLTEQMAVMDLMALGALLLLPEDDLTLATVLKGPLIGLSEQQLFELAWNRGKANLWDTLRRRLLDDPAFEAAYLTLSDLMAKADRLTPHDLFAHVLGPLGGKRRLLARLGTEAEDPLDEFMALTLDFERGHPPSLQGFLRWLETGAVEIKRDLEQGGRDAVRIMTIHGAKGLQAPIVFLPDTMQVPNKSDLLLWLGDNSENLLWPPKAAQADAVCRAGREAQKLARQREMHRLLYVAMTRAEDRLIVCGWRTRRAPSAECWYQLIRDALAPIASEDDDPFLAAAGETVSAQVLRLVCEQTGKPDGLKTAADCPLPTIPLPEWATRPPPPEPSPAKPLTPSRPETEEPAVRSPLATDEDGEGRFRRGRLIHRLLQSLPELAPDQRARAAIRYLGAAAPELDAAQRLAIANEVATVLDDPRFSAVFAPGGRAEVPLVGRIGDRVIAGVVDRLVVTGTEVLVVDFKTNRRPPEQIPDLYIRQMAAYRLALACIYPGHTIRCALVWTDGPRLTEIDGKVLDDALAGMGATT